MDTLVLVTVFFRHGDRTPDAQNVVPLNPYKNHSFFPYQLGELTHKGQARMIGVGGDLRQRYQNFLPDEFYTEMVCSTTSSYTRCQMSLQCVHAGLFPPRGDQERTAVLPWQAVPFSIIPFDEDKYISIHMHCPTLMRDVDPAPVPAEDYNLLKLIQEHTGHEKAEYLTALRTFDFYKTCLEAGLGLPSWLAPLWPEKMQRLATRFWYHFQSKRARIGAGPLIRRVTDEARRKIAEPEAAPGRKIYLYAVHDMNLHLLRGALHIWTNEPIDYGALLILELHKIDGVYGFKVFFQNGYSAPTPAVIPTYGEFIRLEDFEKMTGHLYQPEATCADVDN